MHTADRIGFGLHLAAIIVVVGLIGMKPVPGAEAADDEDLRCLALTIYGEAEADDDADTDRRAIGHVILNRTKNGDYPNAICAVVKQGAGQGRGKCQFSYWCDGKSEQPAEDERWQRALDSARAVMTDGADDPTKGALFFHHRDVDPPWSDKKQETARTARHVFYR